MAAIIFAHAWRILPFATVIFYRGPGVDASRDRRRRRPTALLGLKKFWYVTPLLQLPIALVALLFGIVFTATDMTVVYILTIAGRSTARTC